MRLRNRSRRRDRRTARGRAGMSIIELIVAMVLLAFGLLGLAGVSLRVSAQQRGAAGQQLAAVVVQSRFDSLSSISCQALAPSGPVTGVTTTRGVTERWTISDGNDIKIIADTVTMPSRKNPIAYLSVIPCRD